MKINLAIAASAGALALVGCNHGNPPPPPPPLALADFQCLPVPTEWNEPGSIFYVDATGVAQRLKKVSGIEVKDGIAGIPAFSRTATFDIGAVISTLENITATTGWSAKLGITGGWELTMKTMFDGVKHSVTDEPSPRHVSEWFTREGYTIRDGAKYYLVREAYAATAVDYEIKRGDVIKLGGEAKLEKVAEGKLSVLENKASDSYVLKKTFDRAVNVCIKPQEISPRFAAAGGVLVDVGKVADTIRIKAVK